MEINEVSVNLQAISDVIRYRGIYAEYDQCAASLMRLLHITDPVVINDIMMNFSNPIYWKDICSDYQWCSASYANLLGLDEPRKIFGKTDFDFGLAIQMATDVQEADELALLHGKPTTEERQVSLPDSTTRTLRNKRYPIFDNEGQIIGLLGIVKEVFVPKEATVNLPATSLVN